MQQIRRILLLALTLALMVPVWANEALETFLSNPSVPRDSVSVLIIDLKTGKEVVAHNAAKPLLPASVTKAVTIASLLEKAGIDYVYSTRVYAVGKITDGVLDGNIVVQSSGDPSLNSKDGPRSDDFVRQCVDAMKGFGIRCVKGDVRIDESVFKGPGTPESWAAGDRNTYYGTASHGFNFESNASGKAAVANPDRVFLNRLYAAAAKEGITFEKKNVDASMPHTMILQHDSASLDEILRSCMMRSDNLYAEVFLRTLSLLTGGEGVTNAGAKYEMDFWKGRKIPMEGVNIVDGSGLSRKNRLTAQFLGSILKNMSRNPDYVSFFPLAGQEGTMRNFLKNTPLDGYLATKTGSMNGVQCFAGYLLDDVYAPTHVVVIMMNGFRDRGAVRNAAAKMLEDIFK